MWPHDNKLRPHVNDDGVAVGAAATPPAAALAWIIYEQSAF